MNFNESDKEVTCQYCKTKFKIDSDNKFEEYQIKEYDEYIEYRKIRDEQMYKQQRVTNISSGFVFFIVFIAFFILGVFSFIYSKVTEESKKPTINPFDYLEVTYVGYSYDGEVKLSIKDNDKGFTEKDFEY